MDGTDGTLPGTASAWGKGLWRWPRQAGFATRNGYANQPMRGNRSAMDACEPNRALRHPPQNSTCISRPHLWSRNCRTCLAVEEARAYLPPAPALAAWPRGGQAICRRSLCFWQCSARRVSETLARFALGGADSAAWIHEGRLPLVRMAGRRGGGVCSRSKPAAARGHHLPEPRCRRKLGGQEGWLGRPPWARTPWRRKRRRCERWWRRRPAASRDPASAHRWILLLRIQLLLPLAGRQCRRPCAVLSRRLGSHQQTSG
mmetsp:Transcript_1906/g.4271  ORF Transcript_1906/g.4271 Transcript_1906/m.4271 type:complete len:259 (-) Transcript_1906:270-1046(-)